MFTILTQRNPLWKTFRVKLAELELLVAKVIQATR